MSAPEAEALPSRGPAAPPVVLLHGLGRTRLAMLPLAWHLRRAGRLVLNLGYFGPLGLESAVERIEQELETIPGPLDFVTHSMGGIVARAFLGRAPERGRRLVQLAPPNQGADLADRVRRLPLLRAVPALRDLGAASSENKTGPLPRLAGVEVGVIAGQSFGPWLGAPGDGVVRVSETWLSEAQDWIVLRHFHTLIMNGKDTWANVSHFLDHGRFTDEAARLTRDPDGDVQLDAAPVALLKG
ncbi:MAG: esterase/lipase family protein [Planctomycetota bacterium]